MSRWPGRPAQVSRRKIMEIRYETRCFTMVTKSLLGVLLIAAGCVPPPPPADGDGDDDVADDDEAVEDDDIADDDTAATDDDDVDDDWCVEIEGGGWELTFEYDSGESFVTWAELSQSACTVLADDYEITQLQGPVSGNSWQASHTDSDGAEWSVHAQFSGDPADHLSGTFQVDFDGTVFGGAIGGEWISAGG